MHVAEALGGGLLDVVRRLVEGHVAGGIECVVVHGRRPETPADSSTIGIPEGVRVLECDGWGDRRALSQIRAAKNLRGILADLQADVVVFHSSFAAVVGAIARPDAFTIYVPHAFASQVATVRVQRLIFALGERFACRRHSMVVGVSDSEAAIAGLRGARRVRAIPNGIAALDSPDWPEEPVLPSRPKVIAVGRLVAQRKPFEAGGILASVSDLAEVKWVGGAGSGDYSREASAYLASKGVSKTGWVRPADVMEELASSTVYLHWTNWDGLPISVLEAMAMDALVVASSTEPNCEVAGEEQSFETEQEAISSIRSILVDQHRWQALVLAQRERALQFGASRMSARWNELIVEVSPRNAVPVGTVQGRKTTGKPKLQ